MWTPEQRKVNWFPPYMTNNLVIKIPENTDFSVSRVTDLLVSSPQYFYTI